MSGTPMDAGRGYALTFDGGELTLHLPDGENLTWPAVSGSPGSSAADQGISHYGPIPEGEYHVQPSEFLDGGPGGLLTALSGADWGHFALDIHPDANTDTHGRDGFLIHGGVLRGSAGCIDLGPGDAALHSALKDLSGSIPLTVKYDNPNAFAWLPGDHVQWIPVAGMPQWQDWSRPPDDVTGDNQFTPAPDDVTGENQFTPAPDDVTGENQFTPAPDDVTGDNQFTPAPDDVTGDNQFTPAPDDVTQTAWSVSNPGQGGEYVPASMTDPDPSAQYVPASMTDPDPSQQYMPASMTDPDPSQQYMPGSMTDPDPSQQYMPGSDPAWAGPGNSDDGHYDNFGTVPASRDRS